MCVRLRFLNIGCYLKLCFLVSSLFSQLDGPLTLAATSQNVHSPSCIWHSLVTIMIAMLANHDLGCAWLGWVACTYPKTYTGFANTKPRRPLPQPFKILCFEKNEHGIRTLSR